MMNNNDGMWHLILNLIIMLVLPPVFLLIRQGFGGMVVESLVVGMAVAVAWMLSFRASAGRRWWAFPLFGHTLYCVALIYDFFSGTGGWLSLVWSGFVWAIFFFLRHRGVVRRHTTCGIVVYRVERFYYLLMSGVLTNAGLARVQRIVRRVALWGQGLHCVCLVYSVVTEDGGCVYLVWSVIVWVFLLFLRYRGDLRSIMGLWVYRIERFHDRLLNGEISREELDAINVAVFTVAFLNVFVLVNVGAYIAGRS